MMGYAGSERPRQAILGQLPRIYRADGSPIRVLLVDDEPALTNLVKMALHYEGWVVEIANNGREASLNSRGSTRTSWSSTSCFPTWTGCEFWSACANPTCTHPRCSSPRAIR